MTLPPSIKEMLYDRSLWGLTISNIASLIIAIIQDWSFFELLWIFWAQSIIIGAINFHRIRSLKDFVTTGLVINGRSRQPTEETKKEVANFFLMHYGLFHVVYCIFLSAMFPLYTVDPLHLLFMLLCALGFFKAHRFSFLHNMNRDFKNKAPNISLLLFYPYLRVVPMHISIIVGAIMIEKGTNADALLLFGVLKILSDTGMHIIEHRLFRKTKRTDKV